MPAASTLRAGLRKQGSGTMDSHLLVVSSVSSCWRSGHSEAEMNSTNAWHTQRLRTKRSAPQNQPQIYYKAINRGV